MEYAYYRAGILLGRFWITHTVVCIKRDERTMQWSEQQPFTLENNPFDSTLDLRLYTAVKQIQSGNITLGKEYEQAKCISAPCGDALLYTQSTGNNPLDFIICENRIVAAIDNQRHYVGVLVECGYEALTPQSDFMLDEMLSKPEYGIEFKGTEFVKMNDGVKLATDIYLPLGQNVPERLPVILIRTCYGKQNVPFFHAFIHYGYAMVIQDTRGRDQSEGEFRPIVNEMDDGRDTLEWLSHQTWCDGCVGMIGPSYLSIVQWCAAASGHPCLKAMISQVTSGVPIFDFPHRAGMLSSGTLAWALSMVSSVHNPNEMQRNDWGELVKHRPVCDIPKMATGQDSLFWSEWCEHEYYDAYWDRGNWLSHQQNINVPTLYVSGWYDDVCVGTMQAWDMNKRNQRLNQKMITGAWRHKMNIAREIHNVNFGPDSVRYDMFYIYLKWYDNHLKGIKNLIDCEPAVDYYMLGENKWHTSSTWPPAETFNKNIYLDSCGKANTSYGDGRLTFQLKDKVHTDHYSFDPQYPAPFLLDMSENECLVPENYREVELRNDVLVYTSNVLEEDLYIAGEPCAILYASSDAKDTDWLVRLTEVDETGNSIRLGDGMLRARFRKSFIEPTLLLPNEIVRYEIPLTWIANRFRKGHRIRIQVTSGAENSVFPNTNTGSPTLTDTEYIVANQTVYHGAEYPSHIVLPIVNI